MKKLYFAALAALIAISSCARSQKTTLPVLDESAASKQSWKFIITMNKKQVFSMDRPDPRINTVLISRKSLATQGTMELTYTEEPGAQVNRSFIITGQNDKELWRRDSSSHAQLSYQGLLQLFGDQNTISISTIAIPSDPALAAVVRVRAVHLCFLKLID